MIYYRNLELEVPSEFFIHQRILKAKAKKIPFYLEKWTERTEKIWQGPLLQEGGLELERDDQQTDDDVCQGEVGDEEVSDGLKKF